MFNCIFIGKSPCYVKMPFNLIKEHFYSQTINKCRKKRKDKIVISTLLNFSVKPEIPMFYL